MHLNGISNSTVLTHAERHIMYAGVNREGTPGRKRETFSLRSNNSSSSSSESVSHLSLSPTEGRGAERAGIFTKKL